MSKRVLIWSMISICFILMAFIDYRGYKLVEGDLESNVDEVISDILYPDDVDYVIEDYYERGRIIVFSGYVSNTNNGGPFVVVFKKHWFLPRYNGPFHSFSYTSKYLTGRHISIETFAFKYFVYQLDEKHIIEVERQINYRTFWLAFILILINWVIISERRELQELRDFSN